jgi:hypothetical protein
MNIARLIVAASIAITSVSAFAQSTPPTFNDGIRAQLAQEKTAYRYPESSDRTQAAINDGKRNGLLPHEITGANVGRYSLSVVRPSY